jgi:hypothetical protein
MKNPFPMSTQLQAGCVLHLAYVPENVAQIEYKISVQNSVLPGIRGLTVYNYNTNRHTDL